MTRDEFVAEFGAFSVNYQKVQSSRRVELVARYGMLFPKGEDYATSNEARNQVAEELRKLVAQC